MKQQSIILVCFLTILASRSSFADEEIFPWNTLDSEKQVRSVVEARFPNLHFGFYHWSGDWIIGALEDFDHHRVLLLLPSASVESVKILRNGKELALSTGEPATVKVAGRLITEDGIISAPENATEERMGYWINLEATHTFSLKAKMTWPRNREFQATYDPDKKWRVSSHLKMDEEKKKGPADAYEISRRSLLKQVLDKLDEQKSCLIRMKHGFEVKVISSDGSSNSDMEPLHVDLSDKLMVSDGGDSEEKTPKEFEQLLETYIAIARHSDSQPEMLIDVHADTDDQIFRAFLSVLTRLQSAKIGLIIKKVDDKKVLRGTGKPLKK